jgi:hypothetical protein
VVSRGVVGSEGKGRRPLHTQPTVSEACLRMAMSICIYILALHLSVLVTAQACVLVHRQLLSLSQRAHKHTTTHQKLHQPLVLDVGEELSCRESIPIRFGKFVVDLCGMCMI